MDEADWISELDAIALRLQEHSKVCPCGNPKGCHKCNMVRSASALLESLASAAEEWGSPDDIREVMDRR